MIKPNQNQEQERVLILIVFLKVNYSTIVKKIIVLRLYYGCKDIF